MLGSVLPSRWQRRHKANWWWISHGPVTFEAWAGFSLIFSSFSYVDYLTGELKVKFLYIAEKEKRGAEGQVVCFSEALASLYPENKEVTKDNIIQSLKENHDYVNPEEEMEIESVEPIAPFGFD